MTSEIQFVFVLLIAFQVKHFLGDYVFQSAWMALGKSRPGFSYLYPLSAHVLIHAGLTAVIVLVVNPRLWPLILFDLTVHFVLDRVKASPRMLGRFEGAERPGRWLPLGADQMAHHLTHYAMIWWFVVNRPV